MVIFGLRLEVVLLESTQSNQQSVLSRALLAFALLLAVVSGHEAGPHSSSPAEPKNAWRGIVPLQSLPGDVARVIGVEVDSLDSTQSGPFAVEGGEVTFYYLAPSLAKIYRAPRSLVGRVFTIYFKPNEPMSKDTLRLAPGFKRCVEELTTAHYYLVSDVGLAYQFGRSSDRVEAVIYQPSRAQVRNLAVNTECVF